MPAARRMRRARRARRMRRAGGARRMRGPNGPLRLRISMPDLESTTRYVPSEVEPRIVERWLDSGLFHPEPEGDAAENYSIAIPPPNVTGALHMGHALNNSVQDALIRYARMRGKRDEVDPRHRPRRDRDPDAGRARAPAGGDEPRGARPRGVHRARVGVARAVRRHDHRAAQAARRLVRLRRRALHARRGVRRRRCSTCSARSTARATSTATATWSTGTRGAARRSPTSRSRSAR